MKPTDSNIFVFSEPLRCQMKRYLWKIRRYSSRNDWCKPKVLFGKFGFWCHLLKLGFYKWILIRMVHQKDETRSYWSGSMPRLHGKFSKLDSSKWLNFCSRHCSRYLWIWILYESSYTCIQEDETDVTKIKHEKPEARDQQYYNTTTWTHENWYGKSFSTYMKHMICYISNSNLFIHFKPWKLGNMN